MARTSSLDSAPAGSRSAGKKRAQSKDQISEEVPVSRIHRSPRQPPAIIRDEAIENALKEQCNFNPRAFAIIVCDENGQITCHASAKIAQYKSEIFDRETCDRFELAFSDRSDAHYDENVDDEPIYLDCDDETSVSEDSRRSVTVARPSQEYRFVDEPSSRTERKPQSCNKCTPQKRPRSLSSNSVLADKDEEDTPDRDPDLIKRFQTFRIDDEEALTAFYHEAFEQIQQVALKVILKAWIKAIQPKKQSIFPYSSSNPDTKKAKKSKSKKTDEPRVPPWWPIDKGVRHKEPDHISKDERMKLAVHIVRCFRDNYFNTAKLRESTAMLTLHFPTQDAAEKAKRRREILKKIYDVADLERDLHEGGIDGDYIVNVRVFQIQPQPTLKRVRRPSAQINQRQHIKSEDQQEEQDEEDQDNVEGARVRSSAQSPTQSQLVYPTMQLELDDDYPNIPHQHQPPVLVEHPDPMTEAYTYRAQEASGLPMRTTGAHVRVPNSYGPQYLEPPGLSSDSPMLMTRMPGFGNQMPPPAFMDWQSSAPGICGSTPGYGSSVAPASGLTFPPPVRNTFHNNMEWIQTPAPQPPPQPIGAFPMLNAHGPIALPTPASVPMAHTGLVNSALVNPGDFKAQPPPEELFPGASLRSSHLGQSNGLPLTSDGTLFQNVYQC